jgi:hypothetical protein
MQTRPQPGRNGERCDMKYRRIKTFGRSILRSVLRYSVEVLVWTGPVFGINPVMVLEPGDGGQRRKAALAPVPGVWCIEYLYLGEGEAWDFLRTPSRVEADLVSPCAPLSSAERAEWASLVRRLRR